MKKFRVFVGIFMLMVYMVSIAGQMEASAGSSMFCPECGKIIEADSNFCKYCGRPVNAQSSYSQPSYTQPSYSYSQRIIGYNMVHYGTQTATSPHYRMFRNYSINKHYDYYGARESYGEKHYTRYVEAYMLSQARTYEPGVLIQGDYAGYQKGTDTAYYFGDDKYVWFIESPVYG